MFISMMILAPCINSTAPAITAAFVKQQWIPAVRVLSCSYILLVHISKWNALFGHRKTTEEHEAAICWWQDEKSVYFEVETRKQCLP